MLDDLLDFVLDTLNGLWTAIVEAWFFIFGALY